MSDTPCRQRRPLLHPGAAAAAAYLALVLLNAFAVCVWLCLQVAAASRRILALQQLLGGGNVDVVWMLVREPRLMSADFRRWESGASLGGWAKVAMVAARSCVPPSVQQLSWVPG